MSTEMPVEKKPVTPVEKKRGGCLTAFLIFMLVVSPLYVLIALIPTSGSTTDYLSNWPQWAIYGMGVIGLLSFVSAFAAWKWRKWGVIGLGVAAVAFFALSYGRGAVNILTAIVGITICLAILVRVVRPDLDKMK